MKKKGEKPDWLVKLALSNGWTKEEVDEMTCEELLQELYEAELIGAYEGE